jgi:hypothetical protein
MPDYANGQIYMVCSNDGDMEVVYYGSTCQQLSLRMAKHRFIYKTDKSYTSCQVFDNYGMENCHIELIKAFPCQSKAELEAEEYSYIRANSCVNMVGKGPDIEKRNKYVKQYYQFHKAKIEVSRAVKVDCECGRNVTIGNITTHRKSKIHQKYLSSI